MLVVAALGCRAAAKRDIADARSTVARYIAADTLGLHAVVDSIVAPCEGDKGTDGVVVTRRITVAAARPIGDSVRVLVVYDGVGVWRSDDLSLPPPRGHFAARTWSDSVTMMLGKNADGLMRIACGPFDDNHSMVQQIDTAGLDSVSRRAWRGAATGNHS